MRLDLQGEKNSKFQELYCNSNVKLYITQSAKFFRCCTMYCEPVLTIKNVITHIIVHVHDVHMINLKPVEKWCYAW
jgi:hypothetical protein